MKRYFIILLTLVTVFSSSCQSKFDKKIWHKNNDITQINNPRYDMINDVMKNYLKNGMEKDKVLKFLGKPYSDTIGVKLPEGIKPPDSLSNEKIFSEPRNKSSHYIDLLNEWYKKNYISVPLMQYIIGWSTMDPVFLEIELNNEDKVVDFWVKQH